MSGQNRPLQFPPARGRYAPRESVESLYDVRISVVSGRPSAKRFIQAIRDEMKIRTYQQNTIKDYCNNLRGFLNWVGCRPHLVSRNDVKDFLLYLADSGRSSSTLSGYLAAIRTAFDKLCLREITVGIVTPRKPKKLPVVLSRREIQDLLEATPSYEDKLLLGLMYACGLRVSEVAKLRFQDIDFDRRTIMVHRGKGRRDRLVTLPETFRPLLESIVQTGAGSTYLFPSRMRTGRYISPRTIQRKMQRAVQIAGIIKKATPHSLRHSFATHTFEDGCDIRNIQKLLGHVHLETTTIYVKVARPTDPLTIQSPLDRISQQAASPNHSQPAVANTPAASSSTNQAPAMGHFSFHFKPVVAGENDLGQSEAIGNDRGETNQSANTQTRVTLGLRLSRMPNSAPIYFTGLIVTEVRTGWYNLEIPPLEKWESSLSQLTAVEREKMESPEFFRMLQTEIPRRLAAL